MLSTFLDESVSDHFACPGYDNCYHTKHVQEYVRLHVGRNLTMIEDSVNTLHQKSEEIAIPCISFLARNESILFYF